MATTVVITTITVAITTSAVITITGAVVVVAVVADAAGANKIFCLFNFS